MLAFLILALGIDVNIYVDYKSRIDAKVRGKLRSNAEKTDTFFGDPVYGFRNACSDGTTLLILDYDGTECRGLPTFAGITTFHFDAGIVGQNETRDAQISVDGYDLSVCTDARVQRLS